MSRSFVSVATIKAAIYDVIDQGRSQSSEYQDWRFNDSDSSYELLERSMFADAVIRRIAELQEPPHEGVKLENLCDFHKREVLPEPTAEFCAECEKKQKAAGADV